MPSIPTLQAQVALMAGKVTALETGLADHQLRLEELLTAITTAAANGASVPDLIAATEEMAVQVNATLDTLKAWSDGEVSRTYVDDMLDVLTP